MIIKSVHVENFRCVKSATLHCEPLTALVGANGSGKSSILRALELFYDANAKYGEQDFFEDKTEQPIIIRVTYTKLREEETRLFQEYVVDGELTVAKILTWSPGKSSQKYYGAGPRNPEFSDVRSGATAKEKKEHYEKLRTTDEYADLPRWSKQDDALASLKIWERNHPDSCEIIQDEGQFFGFKEVGQARLERFTNFLFVPAVRDASEDAAEGRGTIFSEMMDMVVRSTLSQNQQLQELRRDAQSRYGEIMKSANKLELENLQNSLTSLLANYAPYASIALNWNTDTPIDIPLPKADIRLVQDGYESLVGKVGHGLQRAFILTMLQYLLMAQSAQTIVASPENFSDSSDINPVPGQNLPDLIIGIEEPELYQHPSRQRHLSGILYELAQGNIRGVAEKTQIIYATHSPLFVDITRFNSIRLFRKSAHPECFAKHTVIQKTDLDAVAELLEAADGKPEGSYSGLTLLPRLQTLLNPWLNEGFFAGIAVLVEGEDDRAAILGVARSMSFNFDSMDISVIPCFGKNNLDRPTAIFYKLQIPTYLVWDSDKGKTGARCEDNHRLLRLMGTIIEDWPSMVTDRFACFQFDLETTMKNELGDLYDSLLEKYCNEYNFRKKEHAVKNPIIIQHIISEAREYGKSCLTLEQIIMRIIELKSVAEPATWMPAHL